MSSVCLWISALIIALLAFEKYPAIDSAAGNLPRFGASCYRFPFAAPFSLLFVWMQSPAEHCPMLKFTIQEVSLVPTAQ